MRVTSQIWVGALLRRAYSAGAFAAILMKGAAEAGAIYIVVNDMNGGFTLLGPALQAAYDDGPMERRFEVLMPTGPESPLRELLNKERNFDSDLWIVEIEDREGRSFVELG